MTGVELIGSKIHYASEKNFLMANAEMEFVSYFKFKYEVAFSISHI